MKVKKGRNSQIARVISLLDIFEGATGGLTVAELHERLSDRGHEIGRRTIYRDLEALSKAGFPVFPEGEEGINQRFTLDRKTRIPDYLDARIEAEARGDPVSGMESERPGPEFK